MSITLFVFRRIKTRVHFKGTIIGKSHKGRINPLKSLSAKAIQEWINPSKIKTANAWEWINPSFYYLVFVIYFNFNINISTFSTIVLNF